MVQNVKNISVSETCKEILLGSLLGDGSLKIPSGYKNARFSFRHSVKQKDYFFWKADALKEISGNSYYWKQKSDGLGGPKFRYQSLALESLTDLYYLTHNKDIFLIQRKWLETLTPLSLAVWWLDDGSLIGSGARRGVICTDPFPYEFQKILADYLYEKWDVRVIISKTYRQFNGKRREYYRLWIRSSQELKKFLRIILPYVKVASMLSKVLLLYKRSELQQRWISEVHSLTGFSMVLIRKAITEKKSRWKHFRE